MQEIIDRKTVILMEFGYYVGDELPVYEFMALSDKAQAVRDERRRALSEGKQYIP